MDRIEPTLSLDAVMPRSRDLFYDGTFHAPAGGYSETWNPATGESLGKTAEANTADVDAAVRAAHRAFQDWRKTKPLDRAALLRKIAVVMREHAAELALLDAANCGNPVHEMVSDSHAAAAQIDFFADVTMKMRIAKEEIFGPVLSVIKWRDEEEMLAQVNDVDYGLTAAIYTTSLATAHRAASRVESGYVWVNNSAAHFLGVPFGGYKQSGVGREESIHELLGFTQLKNINITL